MSSPRQDAVVPGWCVGVLPCAARVGIWDFGRNLNTAVRDAAQGPVLRRGCRLRLRFFQMLFIISLFLAPLRPLPGKGPSKWGCWDLALAEPRCHFLPVLLLLVQSPTVILLELVYTGVFSWLGWTCSRWEVMGTGSWNY